MKNISITINEISARIVAEMLEFYNLPQLKRAEELDQYKDNSPYIKAIEDFLTAYKGAK